MVTIAASKVLYQCTIIYVYGTRFDNYLSAKTIGVYNFELNLYFTLQNLTKMLHNSNQEVQLVWKNRMLTEKKEKKKEPNRH